MAGESKVVSARNENRVLFSGTEAAARDYVENNFPRHHVDPASPAMVVPEPDVLFVGSNGKKEMYLGPEEAEPWVAVGSGGPQDKTGGKA